MSASQKGALKGLARVGVYSLIADWAINAGLDVGNIHGISDTLSVLDDLDPQLHKVADAQASRVKMLDDLFEHHSKLYEALEDQVAPQGKISPKFCKQSTNLCNQRSKALEKFLKSQDEMTKGLDGVIGGMESNLNGLINVRR